MNFLLFQQYELTTFDRADIKFNFAGVFLIVTAWFYSMRKYPCIAPYPHNASKFLGISLINIPEFENRIKKIKSLMDIQTDQ